jgi:hypothetical protein
VGIPSGNAQLLETATNSRDQYRRQESIVGLSQRDLLLVLQETNGDGTSHLQGETRTAQDYVP